MRVAACIKDSGIIRKSQREGRQACGTIMSDVSSHLQTISVSRAEPELARPLMQHDPVCMFVCVSVCMCVWCEMRKLTLDTLHHSRSHTQHTTNAHTHARGKEHEQNTSSPSSPSSPIRAINFLQLLYDQGKGP